jgi:hypothetical protein
VLLGAPFIRKQRRGIAPAGLLILLGLLFLAIGWRASEVSYEITRDGFLDARGWPFGGRIAPLCEIRSVEPSHDPRASQAASLDRLRIDLDGHRTIFVAVEDESGFLDALAEGDAELIRVRDGIVRRTPGSPFEPGVDR